MTNLRKNIMRRVYYAFTLRVATDPLSLHSLFLVACLTMLWHIVSVPNIWANMMSNAERGEVVSFFWEALISTELLTQFTLTAALIAFISLLWKVRPNFNLGFMPRLSLPF